MEKMDGKTMDIVAENVGKLKELFPEAFTEGKVDFEALKEVLGTFVDGRDERYSFTWNGKSKARMIAQTPSTGTLRPCKEESVDWDATQNIFIEGDNLEVLKLLQKSYHKKVKMIYIDPPYNTGKDFVYKDNFKDNIKNYKEITGQVDGEGRNLSNNPETSGRYHTDWLNMMYPRLKLARNLLKDDGIIFISIDNNEISNLRKMCDEVFGEENFIDIFSWQKTTTPPNLSKRTKKSCEYLLCYEKEDCGTLKGLKKESKSTNGLMNQSNNYGELIFPLNYTKTRLSDGIYEAGEYGTSSYKIDLLKNTEVKDGVFVLPVHLRGKFKWSQSYLEEAIQTNINIFIQTKAFSPSYERPDYEPEKPWNIINSHFGVGTNENASDELDSLFAKNFSENLYPKPTSLIKYLINTVVAYDDLILDFFAGSGTAADAVLQLNAEDKENRRFVLVQLPEATDEKSEAFKAGYKTIAEISKERIRRAAAKIKEENPEYQGDLGFKVFKLDSTNIKPWEVDFDMTERTLEDFISNIKSERREEDVLYEVLLKYGLDLTLPISEHTIAGQKVFDIGMGALIICLSNAISLEVVEGIAKLKDELNPEIMRVVFKDSGFKDDVVKTNAVQILKQAGIIDVRSL